MALGWREDWGPELWEREAEMDRCHGTVCRVMEIGQGPLEILNSSVQGTGETRGQMWLP